MRPVNGLKNISEGEDLLAFGSQFAIDQWVRDHIVDGVAIFESAVNYRG
jgi:hypothetical protein